MSFERFDHHESRRNIRNVLKNMELDDLDDLDELDVLKTDPVTHKSRFIEGPPQKKKSKQNWDRNKRTISDKENLDE